MCRSMFIPLAIQILYVGVLFGCTTLSNDNNFEDQSSGHAAINNKNYEIISEDEDTLNVLEYGVTINDSTDDDALIISNLAKQLSIKGGGVIYLPKGVYHTRSPIWAQDNIEFRGSDKYETIIRNINSKYAEGFVFACGWYHEKDIDNVKHYPVKSIEAGDDYVKLLDKTDLKFDIGDIVIIRSGALPRSLDKEYHTSPYAELKKIIEINYESGNIYFEFPFDKSYVSDPPIRNLTLTKLEDGDYGGYKTYITENVTIRNLSVETVRGNWMARDAIYNGRFEDIHVIKAYTLLGGNGKQFCSFRNISGNFTCRLVEMAEGSSNTHIENIEGVMVHDPSRDKKYPLIVLKPGDSLLNFKIINKSKVIPNIFIRTNGDCVIMNGEIESPLSGPLFIMSGSNNYISKCVLKVTGGHFNTILRGNRRKDKISNSSILSCKFIGDFPTRLFHKDLVMRGFRFSGNELILTNDIELRFDNINSAKVKGVYISENSVTHVRSAD